MAKYMLIGSVHTHRAPGDCSRRVDRVESRPHGPRSSRPGARSSRFYFGFGADDYYVTVDFPDAASAAAASLTVGASGSSEARLIVLITPEELDAASQKSVNFRPPGG